MGEEKLEWIPAFWEETGEILTLEELKQQVLTLEGEFVMTIPLGGGDYARQTEAGCDTPGRAAAVIQ